MGSHADMSLADVLARVAARDPTPGAGPVAAWTCGMAAALVEMVSAVELGQDPEDPSVAERRRDRAAELRHRALELAEEDMAAYREVGAVLRRRDEPGHGARLREALSAAADPPMAVAEVAAEITALAADAAGRIRGGAKGEAISAAVMGETAVRLTVPVLDLNLASTPDDPRFARLGELRAAAEADLARATRR